MTVGGKSAKAPDPPDPKVTAAAQAAANKETAISQAWLNNVNQYDPSGSITYNQIGTAPDGTPRFEMRTALSPEQQALYDQNVRMGGEMGNIAEAQLGRLNTSLSSPLDMSSLGALPTADSFSAERDQVTNALMSRLNPQIERDRAAMEARLANQGITQGSEAWNQGFDELNRASTDARMQALLAGGQEQSRMYGMASDARQQGLTELLTARNQPLNEISALLSGSQVSMPQRQPTPQTQIAPTDIVGPTYASYQGQLSAANQKSAAGAANTGAAAGLAGTAISAMMFF